MNGPKIHIPTKEENDAALKEFFQRERIVRGQRRAAALVAIEALTRLCNILKDRSGQCYKVRNLLFSLWNGKPAPLIEVVGLDWEIRQDLGKVILAFGVEDHGVNFFYQALEKEIRKAGQWEWFLEEQFNVEVLAEYVEAAKERPS